MKKEIVYQGSCLKYAPDLLITPEDCSLDNSFRSLRSNQSSFWERGNLNEHDYEGIFLAYGSDIRKNDKLEGLQIIDISPTILHIFKMPISREIDGKVIKEMFKERSDPATRPIKYSTIISEKKRMQKIRARALKDAEVAFSG